MTILTNPQIINDARGNPAFVVIPYSEYQALQMLPVIDTTNGVPGEVVNAVFDKGISPLKAWREYLELTQSEVAQRAGITQSAYSQHEQAEKLSKTVREKLACALRLTAEQLNF